MASAGAVSGARRTRTSAPDSPAPSASAWAMAWTFPVAEWNTTAILVTPPLYRLESPPDVRQGARGQPWGDRGADHPGAGGARDRIGRRVLRDRPRRPARAARGGGLS